MSDQFFVKSNDSQLVAAKFISCNGSYVVDHNAEKSVGTKIYDASGSLIINASPSDYLIISEDSTIGGTLAFATQVGAQLATRVPLDRPLPARRQSWK